MNTSDSITRNCENLADSSRPTQWESINWKEAEDNVNRLQVRIAKATKEGKWNLIKRLQFLLTHSFYAKALAVRTVTQNKGKRTAGVDDEIWSTPGAKMKAVLSLILNRKIRDTTGKINSHKQPFSIFLFLSYPIPKGYETLERTAMKVARCVL